MKNTFLVLLLIFTSFVGAQIKIGDNPQTLNASSLLELESTSKVLVISRMTEDQILALSPLQGAMVYNIDASCIFYYNGTTWNNLCAGGSTGNIAWGSITGTLADQTELAAEFEKYVDLSTVQSIAGEKTLTEKFTVNTGDVTAQSAEFLGRVKGEDGTAPEDFVTKAQLDASGGGGTWGSITGTLTDQTDLATEFQNYVDLTTIQTIAGEKTLTEKFTVNTGDITAQSAEFLGRVKGEDGTEPEDFVTKAQLDASGASTGTEGSIFFAGTNSAPTEDNDNLFWDDSNNQLQIGEFIDIIVERPQFFSDNLTTLNIKGSVSKPFDEDVNNLSEKHHTVHITNDTSIFLPNPNLCVGRIYIIKVGPGLQIPILNNRMYNDSNSVPKTVFDMGVTQIQSSGYNWEQIN